MAKTPVRERTEKQLFMTKWSCEEVQEVQELGVGRWLILTNLRVILVDEGTV
jgi:hypothetical protein